MYSKCKPPLQPKMDKAPQLISDTNLYFSKTPITVNMNHFYISISIFQKTAITTLLLTKQLNPATDINSNIPAATSPKKNPNTVLLPQATGSYDSRSITRMIRLARRWGYLLLRISAAALYLVTTSLDERSSSFSSRTSSSDDICSAHQNKQHPKRSEILNTQSDRKKPSETGRTEHGEREEGRKILTASIRGGGRRRLGRESRRLQKWWWWRRRGWEV